MAKKKKTAGPEYADIRAWIANQPSQDRQELRTSLASFKKIHALQHRREILWWHRLGVQLIVFLKADERHYGSSVVELLADALKPGRDREDMRIPNDLWQARDFARTYTTDEAERLVSLRDVNGRSPTVSHMKHLVSVDDSKQRQWLLEQWGKSGWSGREFGRKMQNLIGRKRSGGGRNIKRKEVPRPAVALRDIRTSAEQWMANHKVWFVGRKAALQRVPKREHSDELYEELDAAVDAFIEMREAVDYGFDCLEKLAGEVQATLGIQ